MAAPEVMGRAEIAMRLGLDRRTDYYKVYRLTLRPGFPAPWKLKGGYVWATADVEAWIAEHRPDRGDGDGDGDGD
ncbi:DNA-binding protein [Actinoplanes bogorensis]|uniref:DNA-binding protein n=1 Tax=Paractinoplanes bogorensis TaxID=1610840 RepID=A0ABS5YHK0_9ACTN|nr:DNA-binding protein [Actinoplanes bogorensis]MBU2662858.1 DNA-binding protein [Actinoplanes bogorensis]